jgi:ParB family transcriptional regulator, chromosome partitioning protein
MSQARGVARGLGRGLDSLIPLPSRAESATVRMLPVEQIRPGAEQPRHHFRADALRDLAESIRVHGLLQPVLVRQVLDGWELIAGERRWRAARMAQLDRIPAVVRSVDDDTRRLVLSLVENLQRENLDPLEEARGIQKLVVEMGLTHEEVAERLGKSRAVITNALRLLDSAPAVAAAVESGAISPGHARALLMLPDRAAQEHGLRVVLAKRLSVRQAEVWAKSYRGPRPARARSADVALAALAAEAEELTGLAVSITGGPTGGRITFRYSNRQELDALLERIRT